MMKILTLILIFICGLFQYIYFETSPKIESNLINKFFITSFKSQIVYLIISILLILIINYKRKVKGKIISIIVFVILYNIVFMINFYLFASKIW